MPKLVDHEQRKELIADATIRVIKHVGLEKTTVRKIAKEAGLSMGSVQYYFPAQHDLYIYAMELLLKRTEERIVNAVHDGDPALEGVAMMLKQLIPNQDHEQRLESEAWLSFSLMALKDEALASLSNKIHQSTREFMQHMLKILQNNKCLNLSYDLGAGAMNLHAFIDGLTLQCILYPDLFDEDTIESRIKDYLQNICQQKNVVD